MAQTGEEEGVSTSVVDGFESGCGGSGSKALVARNKKLFTSLVQECQVASPGSRLSTKLRKRLEEEPADNLAAVVNQLCEACAPLFFACKNGSAEVVDYLLSICHAELEQRGLYEVLEEGISHHVSPLWCAAVSGRLAVVKVLLRHGANVDAVSDSGSTPIRSACYIVRHNLNTAHFDIIRCLVRAGADVQQPNHFGGTCLINSVQSSDLVKFLLESGVDVNAEDVQHKTALHYAVQENRLESAKMLLHHGADPLKRSKYEDDILQTACLKGALMIFNFLLETVIYEPDRIADAFELMGSTFLLDMHDLGSTLFFWRKALQIRHNGRYSTYPKQNLYYHPVFNAIEVDCQEELEAISVSQELLRQQALLITERILGSGHKDTIFRYMYAGAAFADGNEYKPCIALWNYALGLKVGKETLLSCDTSFTARAIVQLFVNVMMRQSAGEVEPGEVSFADVCDTARHVNSGICDALDLLRIRPVCKAQLDNFDIVLATWVHLVYILMRIAETEDELETTFNLVNPILKRGPVTLTGDSLLHLSVSSSATLKASSFMEDDALSLFPNATVAEFILKCGSDVHSRNSINETPLHVACKAENFNKEVVDLLLERGAHLDAPDDRRIRPQDILRTFGCKVNLVPHVSLKCLAAQAVLQSPHLWKGQVLPPNMDEFLRLHAHDETIV